MILAYSWTLKQLLSRQGAPAKNPLLYGAGDRAITLLLFYLGNSLPLKVTSRLPILHASEGFVATQWKKVAGATSSGSICGTGQGTTFAYSVFFAEELEALVTVGAAC